MLEEIRVSEEMINNGAATTSIVGLDIDLGCSAFSAATKVDDGGLDDGVFYYSQDGRHVPLVLDPASFRHGVNASNYYSASLFLPVGGAIEFGFKSEYAPGYRQYIATIGADNESKYDYQSYWDGVDGKDADVLPWYPDWNVSGVTKGPACPGQAATPTTRPIFEGEFREGEGPKANSLLRYEVKAQRNRFHVPAATTHLELTVYYSPNLDSTSLQVTSNGQDIRSLFHPENGSPEKVQIPLEGNRTLIRFKGLPELHAVPKGLTVEQASDIDTFEIRRP
ncbi:MAG: hypothetical protein ACK4E7_15340 [Permianibacter sp.]